MSNYETIKKKITENEAGLHHQVVKALLRDLEYRKKTAKTFDQASARKKRVMIAEDILLQLKMKKYLPDTGGFVELDSNNELGYSHFDDGQMHSVQEICSTTTACEVCEVGGVFMSAVRLNGDVEVEDESITFEDMLETLKKFYSIQQVALMEIAFEGGSGFMTIGDSNEKYGNLADNGWRPTMVDYYIKYTTRKLKEPIGIFGGGDEPLFTTDQKYNRQVLRALKFYRKNSSPKERKKSYIAPTSKAQKLVAHRFALIQRNVIRNNGELIF